VDRSSMGLDGSSIFPQTNGPRKHLLKWRTRIEPIHLYGYRAVAH